ncbi:hypothetical protein D8674_024980 [Pyrus ussuriensis x Pyrus communis]|uniref:Uncharacterized protein n=1 Tax=Pyrus ussuriensis x Pyrus communis TaxID=2448454 RepID=A0A5N5H5E8_9ROSA|nr:hypothetical protein D8674_024980 [Pyrus ussuriensis x Pyrus communis]
MISELFLCKNINILKKKKKKTNKQSAIIHSGFATCFASFKYKKEWWYFRKYPKSRGFVEKRKDHPRSVLASADKPDMKTREKQQETATHHTDIHHLL